MHEPIGSDPHGVVPPTFPADWGCVTIAAALERAERAPSSTTPYAELDRCPNCGSHRLKKKLEKYRMEHRRPEPVVCRDCYTHAREEDLRDPLDECPVEVAFAFHLGEHDYLRKMYETSEGRPERETETDFEWIGEEGDLREPVECRFEWLTPADLLDPSARVPPLAEIDDETLTAGVIRLYRPWEDDVGPSYRQLAEWIPYSRQWIGDRIRAWRREEYRDLVADPEAQKDGAFTRLTNLSAIADALSRDPEHVHSKIQQELGTAGQYESGRARYNGNFRERDFQAAVDSYIAAYVTCSECGLPDTRLETEDRTPMLRCEACGAFRPVAKQQKASSHRQADTIESGKTYELEIVGTGRKGDGVAERGEYTIFVPGAQEGETVRAYIKNVSGNLAFARRES